MPNFPATRPKDFDEQGRKRNGGFRTFGRPVYGYREYNDKGDGAENCFVLDTEKYLYVSVVNYKDNQIAGKVALERLGLSPSSFSSVKELWSGDDVKVGKDGLSYTVSGKDAKIYRFLKK